jgi:hypothetical protein
MTIKTPPCPVCGLPTFMEVDAAAFFRWQSGELIQKAFPLLTSDLRELLKSGTHPDCWKVLFPPEE